MRVFLRSAATRQCSSRPLMVDDCSAALLAIPRNLNRRVIRHRSADQNPIGARAFRASLLKPHLGKSDRPLAGSRSHTPATVCVAILLAASMPARGPSWRYAAPWHAELHRILLHSIGRAPVTTARHTVMSWE